MFAIMGATGKTGRAVTARLAAMGAPFRALTRDAGRSVDGATETHMADPLDAASLTAAFRGATAVYAMIPPYLASPDPLLEGRHSAQAIATAVTAAGVGQVVALSSGGVHLTHGTGPIASLRALEHALAATPARITRLRAADFMENWAGGVFHAAETGVLPTGRLPFDAPMETVSAQDIGRIAADFLLTGTGPGTVNLLGPQDYTPADMAAAAARLLGRTVSLAARTPEDLLADLTAAGVGQSYARGLLQIYAGLNSGQITFEPAVGTTLRGTVTPDQALAAILHA